MTEILVKIDRGSIDRSTIVSSQPKIPFLSYYHISFHFSAFKYACDLSKPETLVIGTTDAGTHGLELATDIKTCIQAKKISMLIILQSLSQVKSNDNESFNAYQALVGDKNVVDIDTVGDVGLQERVIEAVKSGCTQPVRHYFL